jgi:sulfonate transport system substrate-binding protein
MKEVGLKIGGVPEHFNLPWRLAIEEGKFKEIGLDLHWSDLGGGTGQMLRGLETGSIDVAVLLTEGITKAILEGLPAKILQVYVVSPLSWGVHVPINEAIHSTDQITDKKFAISRYGSGSHLMAYVMADQHNWPLNELEFNVVGDVYGGLWALQNDEANIFLWEKYTTFPHVEQKKCKHIGDVVTPWPCFVIAVRNEVLETEGMLDLLKQMCSIVNQKAVEVKNDSDSVEIISWRYNLRHDQVEKWLSEVEWNYKGIEYPLAFEKTTHYLKKLDLLSEENAENWREKLFI